MTGRQGRLKSYIKALKASERFGPQVVAHRIFAPVPQQLLGADSELEPPLIGLLEHLGMTGLYSHQHEAIRYIGKKKDVVTATPTASGKSLIYNLPVFQEILVNTQAKALYIFPLKALARDQLKTIRRWAELLPDYFSLKNFTAAAVYDGDTSGYQRKKIRDNLPAILLSNPDMLHLSLLPYHHLWAAFFSQLTHVVLDEVHTYRGVFGSHMAWVMRRLQRICSLYGSDPVFILSSATTGNPGQLGEKLLGRPVHVITKSGAPRSRRNFILLNPLDSAPVAATMLLEAALHRNLRTIVYTRSRKLTELITLWCRKRCREKSDKIACYRAGFLPEDRRKIERKLADGQLLAVISTSALELGIDIGGLDICLLVGYPGSMMATRQRAGRVGRAGQESLTVLIGHEDALDQNFMRHPDDFFDRNVESVVLDPENSNIAASHLLCAAAESPLTMDEGILQAGDYLPLLSSMTTNGKLLQSADGDTWFSSRKYPQRHVSLRGAGESFLLFDADGHRLLGEIDAYRACRECHTGAVYLHMARTWIVQRLSLPAHEVLLRAADPPYYTRTLVEKDTQIVHITAEMKCGNVIGYYGSVLVTEKIYAYQKILIGKQKVIARLPLDFPPRVFETRGMWLEIPEKIRTKLEREKIHFMGSIHALEHAMIGMMPMFVLCDRNDIGGISFPLHPETRKATIFIYDGYAGGIGLCERAFPLLIQLLVRTQQVVTECGCDFGCPTCVHSPKCGSGNRPIDKNGCMRLLEYLLMDEEAGRSNKTPSPGICIKKKAQPKKEAIRNSLQLPKKWGVFDLETKRSAAEVGGWHKADKMGISVGVIYDADRDAFFTYEEQQVPQLLAHLFTLDIVVGFNNKKFDNRVLAAYSAKKISALPSFDILEQIFMQLGYRLSLDRLAEHTLGVKKSANGLQALTWYKEGEMEKIKKYCEQDVRITRDIFLHGLRKKYLLFANKAGKVVRLPVNFTRVVNELLAESRP